jgi:hypothetical protein
VSPAALLIEAFLGLFLLLLLCLEIGHIHGQKSATKGGDDKGVSTVEGAVIGLVGFLLAFSFAGAQTRLEARRATIVDEANAVGTAYLRTDLLKLSDQVRIKPLFREYVEHRMGGTARLPDFAAATAEWRKADLVGQRIWSLGIEGTRTTGQYADRRLLLDALNHMYDVAKVREVAVATHLPIPVVGLLVALIALAALLAGSSLAHNSRKKGLHRIVLALVFASVMTVLIDLEFPRLGWIQLQNADFAMQSVKQDIESELHKVAPSPNPVPGSGR